MQFAVPTAQEIGVDGVAVGGKGRRLSERERWGRRMREGEGKEGKGE